MQKNKTTAHFLTVLIFIVMIALGFMGVAPFTYIGMIIIFGTICTGGIGLIVIIPVLIAVYKLIFGIICKIMGVKSASVAKTITVSSNKELSIIGYIVNSRAGAINDTIIRSNLKSAGWSDVDIESAFKKSVLST